MNSNNSTRPSAPALIDRNKQIENVGKNELTTEQHKAADHLVNTVDQGVYNLVGSSNSGKTFLAWYLVKEHDDWEYFAWLPVIKTVSASVVFIDNVEATRIASRRAREVKTFNDVRAVVAISTEPIPESIRIQLASSEMS